MYAAVVGDVASVRALLELGGGAGINDACAADGSTALMCACWQGYTEIVRVLLAVDGIDANRVNNNGASALMVASECGYAEAVHALLAVDGIDANCRTDGGGATALIRACVNGHLEVVRALMAVDGIDANLAGDDGYTALIFAALCGYTDIVCALLAVDGIDANLAGNDGCTALIHASGGGHVGCARALAAAAGIRINLRGPGFGNMSALHIACTIESSATRVEMAGLLLTAGGCRFQRNDTGETPLDMAAGDVRAVEVFASGVDYWQRVRHSCHGWGMKEVVMTVLLVRQRVDGFAEGTSVPMLVHVPEEMWLMALTFLRSADFMP
jgi:ankyrin repeat protein